VKCVIEPDAGMRHVQLSGLARRIGMNLLEILCGNPSRRNQKSRDTTIPMARIDVGPMTQVRIERNGRGMRSRLPHLNGVAVGAARIVRVDPVVPPARRRSRHELLTSVRDMWSPTMRAHTSAWTPAPNGTMMVTHRVG